MGTRYEVEELRYQLVTDDRLEYRDPPTLTREMPDFSITLMEGILTCQMKGSFNTVGEAKEVVEPFLEAWAVWCELTLRDHFHFEYLDHEQRTVKTDDPDVTSAVGAGGVLVSISAESGGVIIGRKEYPEPPDKFIVTPDVETLWRRYRGYRDGKEPLLSMANFCLTQLETMSGAKKQRRKRSALSLGISLDVLDTLGRLTAEHGDERNPPRKASPSQPLSDQEVKWLEEVVRMIILRVGEFAANPNAPLSMITMDDLPKVS